MLVIYSQSRSFEAHIKKVIDSEIIFRSTLTPAIAGSDNVYLVHAASFTKKLGTWLNANKDKNAVIAIAADIPQVTELLSYTDAGVRGYFNSYMASVHYDQLLRLLSSEHSWFPPELLTEALDIARSAIAQSPDKGLFENLTKREREIALAVAEGSSNKQVATDFSIKESTVKAHLTKIFKKLQVKDRVALVIYLK